MIETLDIFVIFFYIVAILVIGFISSKKTKTDEDFFLAGRNMPWFPIALSVAATTISANGFIGGPGWAYTDGLAPFMINISVPFACFFAITYVVPIIYKLKIVSIYQYMSLRFGSGAKILLLMQFFANSIIQVSSMVFIPSLLIQIMTGWSFALIVVLIVLCAIIYTTIGGIKAVIWTDALQMFIVWGSILMVIIISLDKINMSFGEVLALAKNGNKLNALDFSFDFKKNNALFITFIGGSIMWIRYFAFDQIQVQRILTAKSIKGIKSSLFSSAIIMNVVYFSMLFIGVILYVFYNGRVFESSNEVMIDFVLNNLPAGFLGLTIAGSLAAAMSSVDSILNSMTTVFVKDIYEVYFAKKVKVTTKSFITITSVAVGIIIIFFVIIGFGGSVRSVLDLVGSYFSYFTGPACAISLLAVFSRRANDKSVTIGFIIGIIFTITISKIISPGWLWNILIGFVISTSISYILSFVCKSSEEAIDKANRYSLSGIKKEIIDSGEVLENNISLIPGKIDKYSLCTLSFFVLQYVILYIITL